MLAAGALSLFRFAIDAVDDVGELLDDDPALDLLRRRQLTALDRPFLGHEIEGVDQLVLGQLLVDRLDLVVEQGANLVAGISNIAVIRPNGLALSIAWLLLAFSRAAVIARKLTRFRAVCSASLRHHIWTAYPVFCAWCLALVRTAWIQ